MCETERMCVRKETFYSLMIRERTFCTRNITPPCHIFAITQLVQLEKGLFRGGVGRRGEGDRLFVGAWCVTWHTQTYPFQFTFVTGNLKFGAIKFARIKVMTVISSPFVSPCYLCLFFALLLFYSSFYFISITISPAYSLFYLLALFSIF